MFTSYAKSYANFLDLQHARSCVLQVQKVRVTKTAVYKMLHYEVRAYLGIVTSYSYKSYSFSCCILE